MLLSKIKNNSNYIYLNLVKVKQDYLIYENHIKTDISVYA